MTGSLPPAGWYPDPSDERQLRWWTGERWTGAARPAERPASDPTTRPEASGSVTAASPTAEDTPADAGTSGAEAAAPDDATREVPLVAAQRTGHGHEPSWAQGTGASWADHGVDDPQPERGGGIAGWPRERKIALGAIAGLLMASVALWLLAVVIQGGRDTEVAVGDGTTTDEGDTATDDDTSGSGQEPDDGPSDAGADSEAQEDEAGNGSADEADESEPRTVDFDGVCSVEVAAEDAEDGAGLRPWQFDECEFAPVNLDAGDGRWIVVVASIDGDLSESEALERAERYSTEYGVLWSTHYPSLNPGWWVVFDGPFSAEDDATRASQAAGGGAYPRLLSDDEGDRYCIAEDGC